MIMGLFQIALRNWNSTLIMDAMLGHLYLATEDPKIGPLPICTSRTEKSSSMKRVCRFLRGTRRGRLRTLKISLVDKRPGTTPTTAATTD